MPEFVMARDRVVATTAGHIIAFKKDVPVFVPPAAVSEVMKLGAVPTSGDAGIADDDEVAPALVLDAETRKLKIVEAIEALVRNNNRGDFGADGKPHPKAISRAVGFTVDAKERNAIWTEFMDKEE